MYRKLIKFLCLLVLCLPCIAQKQAITLKEMIDYKRDYLHEFFRPVADRYLAVNYASPHGITGYRRNYKKTFLVGYDAKLNEVFSNPIKELSGNKYQGGFEFNNQLHIFYADGKKIYRCAIDGYTGNANGVPVQVMTVKKDPGHFYKGYSADSGFCYILFDYETEKGATLQYEGAVLDKSLNVVSTFALRGNYSYTDSYTGSLYVMKIKSEGSLDWLQVVPCSQSESTYPIYSGAIALQRNNKDIVIVLHDNEKNYNRKPEEDISGVGLSGTWNGTSQLTAITIKNEGSMIRSAIGKNMDPKHHLAPNKPFVVYDDEILYTSYHDRNLGRSTYKLGLIRFP